MTRRGVVEVKIDLLTKTLRYPGYSASRLAAISGVNYYRAFSLFQQLEERGLLKIETDFADAHRIFPTPHTFPTLKLWATLMQRLNGYDGEKQETKP